MSSKLTHVSVTGRNYRGQCGYEAESGH